MKQTLAVFTIVVTLFAAPAAAQDSCGTLYAADPAALAAAWLPQLERLHAGIPSLSPREEQWLEEEWRASADRVMRAASSREYALREAKRDAGAMLGLMGRAAAEARDHTEQTKAWIWFAYTLIDSDGSFYLARLVAEGVSKVT